MKITIIGTGAYSLAIAYQLSKNKNNSIILWSENIKYKNEFQKTHKIKEIFKDMVFNNNIQITNNYEEALYNCNLIFLITASKYIEQVTQSIKPYYHNTPICIASKGIEHNSLNLLSKIVKQILNTNNICVISGPTFAIDLINNQPVALAIAGYNNKTIQIFKDILSNETLKLRKSSDIIGIQLCGSIKNIIAIASGIIKGLGYNESTQAFLINESIHDMKLIISKLGGKKKTILSFAGLGDLLLTCTCTKSRNYTLGYIIGSTKDKKQIKKYLENNTVEGYFTTKSIYKIFKNKGMNIPIITLIYNIIFNYQNPNDLINFLITKP